MSCVVEAKVTFPQGLPPSVTVSSGVKPVPVSVSVKPRAPEVGENSGQRETAPRGIRTEMDSRSTMD